MITNKSLERNKTSLLRKEIKKKKKKKQAIHCTCELDLLVQWEAFRSQGISRLGKGTEYWSWQCLLRLRQALVHLHDERSAER